MERMTMQTLPGSTLEVIEAKFFFQLLMSLLHRALMVTAKAPKPVCVW